MGMNQFLQSTGSVSSPGSGSVPYSAKSSAGTFVSTGSNPYDGYYDYGSSSPGDWLAGTYGAAEQATRQGQQDYLEWIRNQASAREQRDWEKMMSDTQVQRAMKDIEAAGLNPWLALQTAGFGGSIPSGASATSSAGQVSSGSGSNGLSAIGTSAVGLAMVIKAISGLVRAVK